MTKKDQDQETSVNGRNFWSSPRRGLYAAAWTLMFCIAAAALGLISQQLQRGGNDYANYGNMMYKHILGILLFSAILVFLMCIGHIYATIGMMAFWVLVAAIFWGVGAGGIWQSVPYRANNCNSSDPQSKFAGTRWGEPQFFSQCSKIVALQGLAWAEWGLLTLMFFGMLGHLFKFQVRPHTSFYGPRG